MVGGVDDQPVQRFAEQPVVGGWAHPVGGSVAPDVDGELSAVDLVIGAGEPQRVGRFKFFLDGQRCEWSDAVAGIHGYEPGTLVPTTELLLQHKHPDDRARVAVVLDRVVSGEPFSSRHRIIDTAGRTHWVIVVGDVMCDQAGGLIGTTGFYIDVTESLQSEITSVLSDVAAARAQRLGLGSPFVGWRQAPTRPAADRCGTGPNWSRCDPNARPTSMPCSPRAGSGCR
jgi:PAS domain S-box-containing protein